MNEQHMMSGFAALVARRREFIQERLEPPQPAPAARQEAPHPAQASQPEPQKAAAGQARPPRRTVQPARTQVTKPMRLTQQKDVLRQTILQTGAERLQQRSTFWVESSL